MIFKILTKYIYCEIKIKYYLFLMNIYIYEYMDVIKMLYCLNL